MIFPLHRLDKDVLMNEMKNYVGNVSFLHDKKGIEVFRLEGDRETPSEERAPHKHNYQEFIWVTEGTGTHIIDGVEHPIVPNSFHIVKKWQIHKVRLNKNAKGIVVLFDDDLVFSGSTAFGQYKYFFSNPSEKGSVLIVDEQQLPFFKATIGELLQLFYSDDEWGKQLLMQNLVESILIKTLHMMAEQNELELKFDNSLGEISSFFVLLNRNYKTNHEVQFYADELNTSVRRLNSILKENFNKTIRELLNDRIIAEAKRLLLYSNLTVKEIAHFLGFQDASYFSRLFRQKCKTTPSGYRR